MDDLVEDVGGDADVQVSGERGRGFGRFPPISRERCIAVSAASRSPRCAAYSPTRAVAQAVARGSSGVCWLAVCANCQAVPGSSRRAAEYDRHIKPTASRAASKVPSAALIEASQYRCADAVSPPPSHCPQHGPPLRIEPGSAASTAAHDATPDWEYAGTAV